MKILFLCPRFPSPALKGDQKVILNRLKDLSKTNEIHLISFLEKEPSIEERKEVEQYCGSLTLVKLPKWKSYFNIVSRGLFSLLPLQVLYYLSSDFKHEVQKALSKSDFDVVHCFMLRLAPYLKGISKPIVLEMIDSMSLNFERRLAKVGGLKKIVIAHELWRLKNYEPLIAQQIKETIVVSSKDKEYLASETTTVSPIGVDTEYFSQKEYLSGAIIAFSGNMSYAPNETAVTWFANTVFPLVKKEYPEAKFMIFGATPSQKVLKLTEIEGVEVTGFVPSIAVVLQGADVAVAPMHSGSGMQFKILEAMSCGLPIVTNKLGVGDIKVTKDKDLLVAEEPAEFAAAVVKLLKSTELSKEIGSAARDFVKSNHSWQAENLKIESIYKKLLH